MTRTDDVRRTPLLVLAALALGAVTAIGSASPSVEAAPTPEQPVVSATSPTTGIVYTARYSCVEQRPSLVATAGDRLANLQMDVLRNGSVIRTERAFVDPRSTNDIRVGFQLPGVPRGETDVTYRFSDSFADGQRPGTAGPVFMTYTPADCPDYAAGSRSAFVAVPPTRTIDTRPDELINYSGPKPGDGAVVKVPASVMPDRPADVTAVSLTLTLDAPTGPGFGQAFPAGVIVPGSNSTVNMNGPGSAVANSAIVPVAADGSVSVYLSTSAHIIVDINGYFVETDGAVAAGRLTSITPLRVFDTRPEERTNYPGPKPSNDSITTVDLTASQSGLPEGAAAALVNITTTQTTGTGFVQAAAAGELVAGESSVLNTSGPNQDVAGLSIVPLSAAGEIDLYTLRSAHLIVDLIGWFTSDAEVASTSGLFVPVPPERVRETRRFESLNQPSFGGSGGCCGTSNNVLGFAALADLASAVVLNVTAIDGERPGFIQIGGRDRSFSTVNYPGVGAVANAAVVPFTPSDACCARPPMVTAVQAPPVDMAVDMSGYFTK